MTVDMVSKMTAMTWKTQKMRNKNQCNTTGSKCCCYNPQLYSAISLIFVILRMIKTCVILLNSLDKMQFQCVQPLQPRIVVYLRVVFSFSSLPSIIHVNGNCLPGCTCLEMQAMVSGSGLSETTGTGSRVEEGRIVQALKGTNIGVVGWVIAVVVGASDSRYKSALTFR